MQPVTVTVASHGAIGNVILRVDTPRIKGIRLYWNGPGSRPRLMLGEALVTIDDAYACANEREARRFARAFGEDVMRAGMRA